MRLAIVEIFGVTFKNFSELCRVLKYSYPISNTVLKKTYGNSYERLIRVRLGMKDAPDQAVHDALQEQKAAYFSNAAAAPAGPGLAAIQSAIRLLILNASDQTLQTAAAAVGATLTPDQMRAALQVYSRGFDMAEAAKQLQKK